MGVFITTRYFEQLGKLAGDDQFREATFGASPQGIRHMVSHHDAGFFGKMGKMLLCRHLAAPAGGKDDRFTVAGLGNIEGGINGVSPGFGRYGAHDAGRSKDRKPTDDSQTGVEGLWLALLRLVLK